MHSQFLNVIRFPVPIEFRNQSLGLRRKIIVGPLVGTIYLPTENIEEINRGRLLRPPQVGDIDWLLKVTNHDRPSVEKLEWGSYFTWNPANPAATAVASVSHAVLRFPESQPSGRKSLKEIARECHQLMPEWHRRLTDWIEILAKDDLDADHPLESHQSPDFMCALWTYRTNGKRSYDYVNPALVLMLSKGESALDKTLWSSAIRSANKRLEPTEVRLLLRDARAALHRKKFRRTVLDAATAVELLIEPALRKKLLQSNSPVVVEHLLKQGWRFSWRKQIMKKLGMWLPPRIEKDLMDVRNGVIHKNASVARPQAAKALEQAEQLADYYEPIRRP